MKKTLGSILSLVVLLSQVTYAAQIASFSVQVSPTTATANQAVDLTVKALDANGTVIKDYANSIWISVPAIKELQDASIPGDGVYTFSAQDQGQKTFSKGLTLKVPGSYTVLVNDINDETIKGETQITVNAASGQTGNANATPITFASPTPGSTETNSTVSVIGNAGVKNATVQILLNNVKVKEEQSNANGDFTSFLTNLSGGKYTLQAQVQDVNDAIVAQSQTMNFTYQPPQLVGLKSFDVFPSKTVKQGQKITFSLRANDDLASAEVLVSGGTGTQKVPLDKMSDGSFQKQLLMDAAGTFTVDVTYTLQGGGASKTQKGIASVSVLEGKGIKQVTYIVDALDKTKLSLAWKPIGDVQYVLVQQGIAKDALGSGIVLTGSTGQIQGLDVSKAPYYIRLFPASASGDIIGEPSDIILIEKTQGSAPMCRVEGISVITKKIGDAYYLTWDAVPSAERYIVYRSDRPVSSVTDMQKVGEASDTKFAYPFDPKAPSEIYAYYAVVAVCQDGTSLQIDGTKKVKVGPATNVLIVLLLTGMIFGIVRMRRISESK